MMRIYCMYYGMQKGTSQTEVTSNSEKIKTIALVALKLYLSKLRHQSINQTVR